MFTFQSQRVAARKRLLNRYDVISFDEVPEFIVDAFFGSCTYKSRLITTTFGFLNGINVDLLISLVRWHDLRQTEVRKMEILYETFLKQNYYSYNVHYKQVMFLNGDIRKFGKRIAK